MINQYWATVRLTTKEYANLTGHSERYVLDSLKARKDSLIEMRIPISDILTDCDKLTVVKGEIK